MIRKLIIFLIISWMLLIYSEGACVWPSKLTSTSWKDNSKGDISFTTDKLTGWKIAVAPTKFSTLQYYSNWICHSTSLYTSDNIIVTRTENPFVMLNTTFYGYICMKLTAITDYSFRYYLYGPEESGAENERVSVRLYNNETDLQTLCFLNNSAIRPATSEYRVMIKTGSTSAAKIDCSYVFLGSYDYNHTDSNNIDTCYSSIDTWSTCQDSKEMKFNYSTCPTKVAYSKSNTVWCVDTVPSGGNNYVTVYNGNDADADIDNATTFRFACFAISGDGTKATVVPNQCRKDQTPTNPISGGSSLTMTRRIAVSCPTCPSLVPPDNGSLSYSTDGASTTVSYTCNLNYSLAGPSTRACQSNRTWADESPTCTCTLPAAPANGSLTVSTNGTLIYSCNAGFVLNGSRTRTCQNSSNTWSGIQPSCDPCNAIPGSAGLATSLSSTGVTTVAAFTCSKGYTLNGDRSATCLVSKNWNATAPTCVPCANFSASSTLNATLSTDGYISTATFTCVTGYHLVGSSSATCSVTGTWNSISTCECDPQAAPSNGTRTGNGSVSQFSCNAGFNLLGSASSYCKTDGTGWSSVAPTCNACVLLTSPTGGYYNFTSSGLVTTATFSCNAGYTMSGSRTRYCQSNGSWNGTSPTCVKCPDLTNPSSGIVTVATDGVMSQAYYGCATGYNISGSSNSTCKTDGTWTSTAPTCYCSPASKLANGAILSDNGKVVYYKCNLNYSISGPTVRDCATNGTGWSDADPVCVLCDTLKAVSGGSVSFSTDDINTKAAYSCDVGYSISGNKAITCLSNGSWDSFQSNCTKCDALTSPTGGNFTQRSVDNTVTKATFTCHVGYTLKGYSELMCKATGSWDNAAPECVICRSRNQPSSGNFTMQTDGQTTTGTYSCASGYTLVGYSSVTCRPTGDWNYPDSTCQCITPTAPANGTVTANGHTVTFTCDTEFTLSGSSTGSCKTDGTGWNISTPQCVGCESLSNFTGGSLSYTSDGTTTSVHYTCPTGTSLKGSATATCNATGNWQSSVPTCVSCSTLPDLSVTTGSVATVTDGTTTTAHYTCPTGYEVKGQATLTCTINGTWSSNASDCVCQTPTAPAGGNFTLSQNGLSVVFACGAGYTMTGSRTVGCATDGSGWNISYPTCTKCNDLTTPTNGNITLVTSGTQTTALFTCGVGYTLSGASSPTCLPNGTWSTSLISQSCVSCQSLPAITVSNGSVTLATNGTTTTAVYNCPAGYEVKGSVTLTCGITGSWDSTPSTCVCAKPALPTGGKYTLSADGLTVTFSCNAGYTISGKNEIACATDGSGWTVNFPNCTRCANATAPAGGNVTLVTNGTQTVAVYTCSVGASLKGVDTPSCQSDGTWTTSQPTCVSCPPLPLVSIATGSVNLVTNGTTTTAVYNCPVGYQVKGAQNITCGTDGTWSSQPSDCVCQTPSNPVGGNYTLSSDGLTVSFACSAGYTMVGTQNITCTTNGFGWAITKPTCTKCANLSSPVGGAVTLTTTGTQTTAVYTCGVGYTLNGQSTPQCLTNGSWTAQQPSCVSCPAAVNISNGHLNVSSDGQTTRALYTCSTGYVMDGNAALTCLANGSWNGVSPECYCASPSAPMFGSVVANKTTAIYTCDSGYILKGTAIRTCQNSGLGWTGTDPSCINCEVLQPPSNGSIGLSSNGTLTVATFSCKKGFSISGTHSLVCLVNGSWSGHAPTCVKCPDLSQPSSGTVVISTDNVTTSALYTCSSGYHVVGSSLLTCFSTGNWSDSIPFCACDNVTAPANGTVSISVVQGVAQYTCNLGYSIKGVSTRFCAVDGSGWSHSQPSCVGCPNMTATSSGNSTIVSNGTVTSVDFKCDVGATLNGPSTVTCQSNGTWTSVQPNCVNCPSLSSPTSGTINMTTNGLTSTVTYTCASSYYVVGTTSRQCQTNGTWSGTGNTTCVCTIPSTPSNGTLTFLDSGMRAVYTCNLYFTLNGNSERTCRTDGSGWTGQDPTCVKYKTPQTPPNGNLTFTTNGTHTIATFTCKLGTTLNGEAILIWLPEGRWSAAEPTCATCSNFTSLSSGSINLTTDGTVTIAIFKCLPGYHISGESVLTCQKSGSWSGSMPKCSCNDTAPIANGHMSSTGTTATFKCDVGYSLSGSAMLNCGADGTGWDKLPPTCVHCATLTPLTSGSVTQSTDGLNTMATFRCNIGQTMNGSSVLKCNSAGSWNGSRPECVTCENYVPPANGQYNMSTDGMTTSIQLHCNEGYQVSGMTTVQCGTNGQWQFTQQSSCEKVTEVKDSLLGALIGVTVTSLIIIAVLSILLARFVHLYMLKSRRGNEYISDYDSNGNLGKKTLDHDPFQVPMVRMTTSMAPVNHQRHVLEGGGQLSTSPAPHGFEKHVIGNGVTPQSPPPVQTYRPENNKLISFRRSATSMTNSSLKTLSAVQLMGVETNGNQEKGNGSKDVKTSNVQTKEHKENCFKPKDFKTPNDKKSPIPFSSSNLKANRLSPIPSHQQVVGKLGQSPQIKRLQVEDSGSGRNSPERRSATPTHSHSLSVSDWDSKSLDSVSMIDN